MKVVLSSAIIKEMATNAMMAVLSDPALRSAVSLRYDEKQRVQVVATATRKVYRKAAANRPGAVPIGEYTLTISRPPHWVRRRIRSLIKRGGKNLPGALPTMIARKRRITK